MVDYIKKFKECGDEMVMERHIESIYNKLPNLKYAIDIGANHGTHTKGILKVESCIHLVAIEANPEVFEKYLSSLSDERLRAINAAVTPNSLKKLKEVSFKIKSELHGRGGIKGLHIWKHITPEVEFETITVPTINFDDLLLSYFTEGVDFIKIDIEGGEYSLILESELLLTSNQYRPILVLENSVFGLKLAKKTFKELIDFTEGNNSSILDFNYNKITTEKDLYNYHMVWICPNEKIKDLIQ
jgi:FkbM family methyltransferase